MSTTVKFNNVTLIATYEGLTVKKGIFKKAFLTWASLEHLEDKESLSSKMKDHTVFQVSDDRSGVVIQSGLEFTVLTTHGRVDMMNSTAIGLIPIVKSLYQNYRWYKH